MISGQRPSPSGNRRALPRLFPLPWLLLGLLVGPARAETYAEASASLAAGATDNALSAATGSVQAAKGADQFTILRIGGRLFRVQRSLQNDLQYTGGITRYAENSPANSQSHALSWVSTIALSRPSQLKLQLTGGYSRTNSANPLAAVGDGTVTGGPTGGGGNVLGGPVSFIGLDAQETFTYQPKASRLLVQGLRVGTFVPLSDAQVSAIVTQGLLRGEVTRGRDTGIADLTLGLTWNPGAEDSLGQEIAPATRFLFAQALTGIRRELSPVWAANAEVGGLAALQLEGGPIVVGPAWRAGIRYRREFGQASLEIARFPQPNTFSGEALIADRVSLQVGIPLDRRERFFLLGLGSYQHGRVVSEPSIRGPFAAGSYVRTASGALAFRPTDLPMTMALDVSYFEQEGRAASMGSRALPAVRRSAVMLIISGILRDSRPRQVPVAN